MRVLLTSFLCLVGRIEVDVATAILLSACGKLYEARDVNICVDEFIDGG